MAVALVVALAVAEWWLRPAEGEPVHVGSGKSPLPERHLVLREWEPDTVFAFAPPEIRRQHPGGPVHEAYELAVDSQGFIEPSLRHESPELEIVFLGGSTTECLYVTPESRFPHLAGRLLEERSGRRINAINAAKSGNNSLHSILLFLGKIAPRRPDFVVFMHNTNDLGLLARRGSYWTDDSDFRLVEQRERTLESLVKDLRDLAIPTVYRTIRQGARQLSAVDLAGRALAATAGAGEAATGLPPDKAEAAARWGEDFKSALLSFVHLARSWGIRPVLMTQVQIGAGSDPEGVDVGAYLAPEALERGGFTPEGFDSAHAYFNAIVRHVALSEGVLLIDPLASGDWSRDELYDGLHFTDRGSERVAGLIADALAAEVMRAE